MLSFARRAGARRAIARAGVAAFTCALLFPGLVSAAQAGTARESVSAPGTVAASLISETSTERVAIPNARGRIAPATTPAPAPEPTPGPTAQRAGASVSGQSVLVTASWYGPGFYENRLPCWQWLQANGLAIQFLPDTWGVAHRTLPCGTMVQLTRGSVTVTVPVVDRGPYVAGRELDLSARVKSALGCSDLCSLLMQIP